MKALNKRLTVILFLAAGVIISVAATKPSSKIVTTKKTVTDSGFFKNLQVLPKNISKDSLDMIMDGFKAALGVRCNFCHVFNGKPDFASDEKPEKNIARKMMQMTADINAKYFNWEQSTRADTISVVKCITCHRQSPHPDEVGMDSSKMHDMMPPPAPGQQAPPPHQ